MDLGSILCFILVSRNGKGFAFFEAIMHSNYCCYVA